MFYKFIIFLHLYFLSMNTWANLAQPHKLSSIIVTADKTPTELSRTASSVIILSGDDIESKYQGSALKALKAVSGIEIFNQGGVGRNASLFLRGGNSEHVLVLVDGVEVNDSISPTRAFDFC